MARLTREESRAQTIGRIHESARREFAQYGIAGASIDRIAESAGYSRGAFYSNFKSKNEIALSVLRETTALEMERFGQFIKVASNPIELCKELESTFNEYASNTELRLLNAELRLEAERDPEFGRAFDASSREMQKQLLDLIKKLCATLAGNKRVDTAYVAYTLVTFTNGLVFRKARLREYKGTPGRTLIRLLYDLLGQPAKLAPLFP